MARDLNHLGSYDFFLPEGKIARYPHMKRDEAKLLIVNKKGEIVSDGIFRDIKNYLRRDDLLILNDTKVMKTRLYGLREKDRREAEILLVKMVEKNRYEALIKNRKRFRVKDEIIFSPNKEGSVNSSLVKAIIEEVIEDRAVLVFDREITPSVLDGIGNIPIPPYLNRKSEEIDNEFYQTVFSSKYGSFAAPTAGLHFTDDLIRQIKSEFCSVRYLTLHVGWGTFSPIRVEDLREHHLHFEQYSISSDLVEAVNETKKRNGRVIACGTTSLRALEGNYLKNSGLIPEDSSTDIFIKPGYSFNVVDSLITNFHTPRSSLMLLVSAFAGYENIMDYYDYALNHDYRFFSYGDAMFILDE